MWVAVLAIRLRNFFNILILWLLLSVPNVLYYTYTNGSRLDIW